jgi:RNA polymerase sigma factor for flagellar operon FliA
MALSPEQLKRAWLDFKVYQNPQSRVELIDHYSYLVKITAGRLVTSLPGGLDREDLIGAGVIGLIKSVDQFDPMRDVKFETYAIALIRGAFSKCFATRTGFLARSAKSSSCLIER